MAAFHPLQPTRTIRDPIHGSISLTEDETEILNHTLFRRLHRIRQNGLLYLVFPSASHTRFEHSVGALFVADAILQALYSNSITAASKTPAAVAKMEAAVGGQAVDIADLPADVTAELFRITRLAALVHDLGHGPFSHHFDPFAPKREHLRRICSGARVVSFLATKLSSSSSSSGALFDDPPNDRVDHEFMSCLLFTHLWGELGRDASTPEKVAAVVLGDPAVCPDDNLRTFVPLMHDIVASAPADADRMDYLERDSRSLGVSYGLYDRNRLLKSFLVYLDDRGLRLGIKKSGARAVENFVQARFELFVQIYYHKTNRAIQLMLGDIARQAAQLDPPIFSWATLDDLVSVYEDLSDERFLRVLRGLDEAWRVTDAEINRLADDIYHRRLWKRLFDGSAEEVDALILKFNSGEVDLVADKVDPKATKDLGTGARLLIRSGDGTYRHTPRTWRDESAIVAALAQAEGKISRVYQRSSDSETARSMRVDIWNSGIGAS